MWYGNPCSSSTTIGAVLGFGQAGRVRVAVAQPDSPLSSFRSPTETTQTTCHNASFRFSSHTHEQHRPGSTPAGPINRAGWQVIQRDRSSLRLGRVKCETCSSINPIIDLVALTLLPRSPNICNLSRSKWSVSLHGSNPIMILTPTATVSCKCKVRLGEAGQTGHAGDCLQ